MPARADPALPAPVVKDAPTFITKWIDYSNKYGFGFQLSDRSIGVLFNDNTRISYSADRRWGSSFLLIFSLFFVFNFLQYCFLPLFPFLLPFSFFLFYLFLLNFFILYFTFFFFFLLFFLTIYIYFSSFLPCNVTQSFTVHFPGNLN